MACESFSVIYGDAVRNIKKNFANHVAKRSEKVQFHPSQRVSKDRDGTTIIELQCRGHRELIHEICHPDWLEQVIIEKPMKFKNAYDAYITRLAAATKT